MNDGVSNEVRRALEAILFLADEPITVSVLAQAVERGRREVEELLLDMSSEHEARDSGIVLQQVAGGWRLVTHPAAAPYVEQFILSSRHTRFTKASLETLAIVAYKPAEFLERLGLASVSNLPPLAPLLGDDDHERAPVGD